MSSQLKALEAFAADPILLRLESLLKRFNLFEAIGVIRQELRHSDLLACLLDPGQSHGLEAVFLRAFLRAVQQTSEDGSTLATLDLDALRLDKCYVLREWHHIDILVIDNVNRLAIIIENKIDTKESPGQLIRYFEEVSHHANYQNYQIIALYLTPKGDEPSFDRYLCVSYTQVCEVIGQVIQNSPSKPTDEIVVVLEHYAQMLRRHIVSDSDIADLCQTIYQKHKQALDLIIEHRVDQKAEIKQYIESLIQQRPDISFNYNRGYVVFMLHEWQNSPRHRGEFGDNIRWILYFEFSNIGNGLRLDLKIAPGDALEREKHLQMAQHHRFRGFASNLNQGGSAISSVPFLTKSDYEKTQEEIEAIISEKWDEYLRDELPRIVEAVRQEEWLWTLP